MFDFKRIEAGSYTATVNGLEVGVYRGLYRQKTEWTIHIYSGHNRKIEGFSSKKQAIEELPLILKRLGLN